MIKAIEAERDAIASAKAQTEHTSAKKMQDLATLKCIGPEFASTLVGEVFYALLTIANNWRAMSD